MPRRQRWTKRKLATLSISFFLLGACFGLGIYHFWVGVAIQEGPSWTGQQVGKSVNIVAVKPDKSGVMLTLGVTITPGKGRVLEDTHQLKGFDFQLSHHLAVEVASKLTGAPLDADGVGLKGADVLFEVFSPAGESVEISAIDGPSAGAAAALAVIAAIENSSVRADMVITGSVREDGSIGPIGGLYVVRDQQGELHVLGKPEAAYEAGMNTLLVPKGQPVEYYEPRGWWWVSTYKSISFLQQCVNQMGWPLEIREVSTIEDAAEIMLEG